MYVHHTKQEMYTCNQFSWTQVHCTVIPFIRDHTKITNLVVSNDRQSYNKLIYMYYKKESTLWYCAKGWSLNQWVLNERIFCIHMWTISVSQVGIDEEVLIKHELFFHFPIIMMESWINSFSSWVTIVFEMFKIKQHNVFNFANVFWKWKVCLSFLYVSMCH